MPKDRSYIDIHAPGRPTVMSRSSKAPMVEGSLRADWSPTNQAWIIRPHNPAWTPEVLRAAPVLRVIARRDDARAYLHMRENPLSQPQLVVLGVGAALAVGAAIYLATRKHGPPGGGAAPVATVTRTLDNNGQTVTLSLKRDVLYVALPVAGGTGYRWVPTETISPPPVAIQQTESVGSTTPGAPIEQRWIVTPAVLGNGTLQWALLKPDGGLSGDSFVLNVIVAE